MSHRIHKYPIVVAMQQFIEMPVGSKILTVQTQRESPQLWAAVDVESTRREGRDIRVYATGTDLPDDIRDHEYIGTFQLANGALVFHVFEAPAVVQRTESE